MWIPTHIQICNMARAMGSLLSLTVICGCATPLAGLDESREPWTEDLVYDPIADDSQPVFDEDDSIETQRLATRKEVRGIVFAPKPFRWDLAGQSAGNRDLQKITAGSGDYRILVIGSLAGHDPSAIELTETLAREIHDNSIVLGGIEVTVIRNANPDGELSYSSNNDDGVRVSRQFADNAVNTSREAKLIQRMLKQKTFHRIIHVRGHSNPDGVIAANTSAKMAAREVSSWLGMEFVSLPGRSKEGTLERWICESHDADIVTFAIPRNADEESLWEVYGDSLMNLLLEEDFETRELTRKRQRLSSVVDDDEPTENKRPGAKNRPDYQN